MQEDYHKLNVKNRVAKYDKKAIYEELKLKEIEIRKSLIDPEKLDAEELREDSVDKSPVKDKI